MIDAVETLRASKALIDTPEKWMQNFMERNQTTKPCSTHDPHPDCFCFIFAPHHSLTIAHSYATHVLRKFVMTKGFTSVGDFVDDASTTHADVMAFFDSAIALAEATA